ncbi:type I restriction endonuclease [Streptomyces indonesiensis]
MSNMGKVHQEKAFGTAIVNRMLANGWKLATAVHYQPGLALDTGELFTFIGRTQNKAWLNLVGYYGGDVNTAQHEFAKQLAATIDKRDTLHVLRKGITSHGIHFDLAYFKPSLTISPDALREYDANRLTVVRELPYAAKNKDQGNKLDLTLFVNGIPVATAELKNPLTGTGTAQAIDQYRTSRDHREPIFAKRALVHFAVDPTDVFLTTKLKGKDTIFLPFNTGSDGPGRPAATAIRSSLTTRPRARTAPPTSGRRSGTRTSGWT